MLLYIYIMHFIMSTICFILFYFLQMSVLSAGIHMHHTNAVHQGHTAPDALELELQVVSNHVGAGNQPWVLPYLTNPPN